MKGSRTPKRRKDYPEYAVWFQLVARCHNSNHADYYLYGARGVTVCERWRNDFAAFILDMGERPSDAHSIDRIDTNGPYHPDNCRWVTIDVQVRNKRNNRMVEHNGVTMCVTDWAATVGMDVSLLIYRLDSGLDLEQALTKKRFRTIEFDGLSMTMKEWAKHLGISYPTLASRLNRDKLPVEQAFQPVTRTCKGQQ